MWPFCAQPMYYGGMPSMFNLTILNGMGVSGRVVSSPRWVSVQNGEKIEMSFDYPEVIWPWTGYFALNMRVSKQGEAFNGTVEGYVIVKLSSSFDLEPDEIDTVELKLPVKVRVIPVPPKEKRILWDQFHNLRYPSGYFPRDSLNIKNEPFDWNGDHIHTNFKGAFTFMRSLGYYIDVLGVPYTCVDFSLYSTLLLVDPEDEFFPHEIDLIEEEVKRGLSVAVFADWYNEDILEKLQFYDENTKQTWLPLTGGSNIPALNALLDPFGIQFGDRVYEGQIDFEFDLEKNFVAHFSSGNEIAAFPAKGLLVSFNLNDQTSDFLEGVKNIQQVYALGLYGESLKISQKAGYNLRNKEKGRVAVFGDSSCIDDAQRNYHQLYRSK
eukprot:TRINITY_DN4409_c0_g1_i2.p1 TRINITY_DN4409_c0_g1~~TRINITY_DN4409_c0_g1_i2.p1  ORF type:complete len:381 (+),score=93.14 TRINITY_DN4409_c0_g1_i2:871-2013(+)